jgi:peptidoglycan hydrolase-like protein with peptidoglycan-binding domain
MMDDGNCKVAPAKTFSGSPAVVDQRRPGQEDITIERSVGQGGANQSNDVFKIQYALDQVAPIDGGPTPPLKVDGLCGPKTIKAIRDFQMKHFGWQGADGRIDPGRQTLAMLNLKRNRNTTPHLPPSLATTGWLLADFLKHVPHTRACVEAAIQKVQSAKAFGPGTYLVEKHYRTSANMASLNRIENVYSMMLKVLDRADFYTTLDTTDEGEGISSVAFARLGGFFIPNNEGKIKIREGAWVASNIPDFAAFVMIHEMRHFVEQQGDIGHHGKGWVTDEGMVKLRPDQTIFNCDTYAGFALEARNGEMQRPGWVKSTAFR